MNRDLIRLIETIHREREIDKEVLFQTLESALASAIRKRFGVEEELTLKIDRESGEIDCEEYDLKDPRLWTELGRIAAQAAKQVMMQRLREAERDVIFDEYEAKAGQLVNGTVQRFEGEAIIVSLGRAEGILPREERARGEIYRPGDRIRCLVLEVKKIGPKVKIILSRASPELVRRLFELEVPEIADGILEIRRIVREPGYRTKIAVWSKEPKIDCVGACVGVRGARIKSIIDELGGEKIDIIRWSDSLELLIMNALKPAQINVDNIFPDEETRSSIVLVDEDQQSLAIGRGGRNVRLASRLVGWEIEIKTRAEFEAEELARQRGGTEGVEAGSEGGTEVETLEESADEPSEVVAVAEQDVPPNGSPAEPAPEVPAKGEGTAEGAEGGDSVGPPGTDDATVEERTA